MERNSLHKLYISVFGRAADNTGFGYWIDEIGKPANRNLSKAKIVSFFLQGSNEGNSLDIVKKVKDLSRGVSSSEDTSTQGIPTTTEGNTPENTNTTTGAEAAPQGEVSSESSTEATEGTSSETNGTENTSGNTEGAAAPASAPPPASATATTNTAAQNSGAQTLNTVGDVSSIKELFENQAALIDFSGKIYKNLTSKKLEDDSEEKSKIIGLVNEALRNDPFLRDGVVDSDKAFDVLGKIISGIIDNFSENNTYIQNAVVASESLVEQLNTKNVEVRPTFKDDGYFYGANSFRDFLVLARSNDNDEALQSAIQTTLSNFDSKEAAERIFTPNADTVPEGEDRSAADISLFRGTENIIKGTNDDDKFRISFNSTAPFNESIDGLGGNDELSIKVANSVETIIIGDRTADGNLISQISNIGNLKIDLNESVKTAKVKVSNTDTSVDTILDLNAKGLNDFQFDGIKDVSLSINDAGGIKVSGTNTPRKTESVTINLETEGTDGTGGGAASVTLSDIEEVRLGSSVNTIMLSGDEKLTSIVGNDENKNQTITLNLTGDVSTIKVEKIDNINFADGSKTVNIIGGDNYTQSINLNKDNATIDAENIEIIKLGENVKSATVTGGTSGADQTIEVAATTGDISIYADEIETIKLTGASITKAIVTGTKDTNNESKDQTVVVNGNVSVELNKIENLVLGDSAKTVTVSAASGQNKLTKITGNAATDENAQTVNLNIGEATSTLTADKIKNINFVHTAPKNITVTGDNDYDQVISINNDAVSIISKDIETIKLGSNVKSATVTDQSESGSQSLDIAKNEATITVKGIETINLGGAVSKFTVTGDSATTSNETLNVTANNAQITVKNINKINLGERVLNATVTGNDMGDEERVVVNRDRANITISKIEGIELGDAANTVTVSVDEKLKSLLGAAGNTNQTIKLDSAKDSITVSAQNIENITFGNNVKNITITGSTEGSNQTITVDKSDSTITAKDIEVIKLSSNVTQADVVGEVSQGNDRGQKVIVGKDGATVYVTNIKNIEFDKGVSSATIMGQNTFDQTLDVFKNNANVTVNSIEKIRLSEDVGKATVSGVNSVNYQKRVVEVVKDNAEITANYIGNIKLGDKVANATITGDGTDETVEISKDKSTIKLSNINNLKGDLDLEQEVTITGDNQKLKITDIQTINLGDDVSNASITGDGGEQVLNIFKDMSTVVVDKIGSIKLDKKVQTATVTGNAGTEQTLDVSKNAAKITATDIEKINLDSRVSSATVTGGSGVETVNVAGRNVKLTLSDIDNVQLQNSTKSVTIDSTKVKVTGVNGVRQTASINKDNATLEVKDIETIKVGMMAKTFTVIGDKHGNQTLDATAVTGDSGSAKIDAYYIETIKVGAGITQTLTITGSENFEQTLDATLAMGNSNALTINAFNIENISVGSEIKTLTVTGSGEGKGQTVDVAGSSMEAEITATGIDNINLLDGLKTATVTGDGSNQNLDVVTDEATITLMNFKNVTLSGDAKTATITGNNQGHLVNITVDGSKVTTDKIEKIRIDDGVATATVTGSDMTTETLSLAGDTALTVSSIDNIVLENSSNEVTLMDDGKSVKFIRGSNSNSDQTIILKSNEISVIVDNVENIKLAGSAQTVTITGTGSASTLDIGKDQAKVIAYNIQNINLDNMVETATITGNTGTAQTLDVAGKSNKAVLTVTDIEKIKLGSEIQTATITGNAGHDQTVDIMGSKISLTATSIENINLGNAATEATISGSSASTETLNIVSDGLKLTVTEIDNIVLGNGVSEITITADDKIKTISGARDKAQIVSYSKDMHSVNIKDIETIKLDMNVQTATITGNSETSQTLEVAKSGMVTIDVKNIEKINLGSMVSGGTITGGSGVESLSVAKDDVTLTLNKIDKLVFGYSVATIKIAGTATGLDTVVLSDKGDDVLLFMKDSFSNIGSQNIKLEGNGKVQFSGTASNQEIKLTINDSTDTTNHKLDVDISNLTASDTAATLKITGSAGDDTIKVTFGGAATNMKSVAKLDINLGGENKGNDVVDLSTYSNANVLVSTSDYSGFKDIIRIDGFGNGDSIKLNGTMSNTTVKVMQTSDFGEVGKHMMNEWVLWLKKDDNEAYLVKEDGTMNVTSTDLIIHLVNISADKASIDKLLMDRSLSVGDGMFDIPSLNRGDTL